LQNNAVEKVVDSLRKEEEEEGSMVVPAHTVSYPKTMVVKTLNADLTFVAMLGPVITLYLAFIAKIFFRFGRTDKRRLYLFP